MPEPARKKMKRTGTGLSTSSREETDRVLAKHKETLHEKMQVFLDNLPALTTRYHECWERVKQLKVTGQAQAASATPAAMTTTNSPAHPPAKPSTPTHKAEAKKKKADGESHFPSTPLATAAPRELPKEARDLPQPPDNSLLLGQLALVKSEADQLEKQLQAITEWIALMVPTIKDEDNAGVEVQMQVHSELTSLAKEIEAKYELESEYIEGRANIESKYYKHFLAPSWIKLLEKHDQNRWDDLEIAWKELVRITLNAYTLVTNNLEKLKNPRSQSHSSYMTM
eukprot:TRINITY_DN12663_c0_g1_i1.p1 TRINITY_DN12663_c0_g1~~TRINITY_DN12663_c0_g1_i1.p1  ORF type:complete len:283 (+),score=128.15 TRINITY_DN12663_c0_g1_i1:52-900(+)